MVGVALCRCPFYRAVGVCRRKGTRKRRQARAHAKVCFAASTARGSRTKGRVGGQPICLSAGRSTGGKPSGQNKASYEPPGARPSTGDGGGEPNGRQETDLSNCTSSGRATTADAELLAADDNRQQVPLLRVRLAAKPQSGSRECLPRRDSECERRRGGRQDEGSFPSTATILCASRST